MLLFSEIVFKILNSKNCILESAFESYTFADQCRANIPLKAVKAAVKSGCSRAWLRGCSTITHRVSMTGGANFTNLKSSSKFTREDEVLLAQMRTGECYTFGKFRKRVGIGTLCRWCTEVDETVFHVFYECTNIQLIQYRKELKLVPSVLKTNPKVGLDFYAKAILLLPPVLSPAV